MLMWFLIHIIFPTSPIKTNSNWYTWMWLIECDCPFCLVSHPLIAISINRLFASLTYIWGWYVLKSNEDVGYFFSIKHLFASFFYIYLLCEIYLLCIKLVRIYSFVFRSLLQVHRPLILFIYTSSQSASYSHTLKYFNFFLFQKKILLFIFNDIRRFFFG